MKDIKKKGHVKTVPIDKQNFKAHTEDGERIIEGYFTNNDIDRIGDVSTPKAFEKTIKTFMENPLLMWMHDWDKPIGKIINYEIDEKGVYIRAKIAEGVDWIDDIWKLIEQGVVKGFSYGYKVNEAQKATIDGKEVNQLTDVDLFEVSVVTIPMNQSALFTMSSAGAMKSIAVEKPAIDTPEKKEEDDTLTSTKDTKTKTGESEDKESTSITIKINALNPAIDDKLVEELIEKLKEASDKDITLVLAQEEKEDAKDDSTSSSEQGVPMSESSKDYLKALLEGKGPIMDEIEEENASRILYRAFWALTDALREINLADANAEQEVNALLDEFAQIAKDNAIAFIQHEQAECARYRSLEGAESKVGRTISEANSKTIESAAQALDNLAKQLREIVPAITSEEGAEGATKSGQAPENIKSGDLIKGIEGLTDVIKSLSPSN